MWRFGIIPILLISLHYATNFEIAKVWNEGAKEEVEIQRSFKHEQKDVESFVAPAIFPNIIQTSDIIHPLIERIVQDTIKRIVNNSVSNGFGAENLDGNADENLLHKRKKRMIHLIRPLVIYGRQYAPLAWKFLRGETNYLKTTTSGQRITAQFQRNGGMQQAVQDFNKLRPNSITPIQTQYGPGYTGTLPNGVRMVARPGSSGGRPTLDFQGKGINYKVRYD